MVKIISLKNEVQKEIKKARDLKDLDQIFQRYLGKKGKITILLKNLKSLPKEKRKRRGKELNSLKEFIEKEIEEKAKEIKEKLTAEILKKEKIDVTAPGKKISPGHLHPLTQVQRKVEEIFQSMGFSIVEGPEIETEWYNFDALNIPKDHPARDLWNTLWLRQNNRPRLLLRTHTSPVQVRYMEKNQPPLRIIVPGRVFRHEATDASHEVNFYHLEGLMVDKAYSRQSRDGSSESLIQNRDVSVANFKAIIQKFYQKFFEKNVEIRLIPCYFPFTEPSFEVDITCLACGGKGCSACQKTGWMEMMGAGMVHPNVFKNSGLNPKEWQGFAFGMGLDRLAMMKYKINDIRLFYSGDLRFLEQF
jgi:phenylalanyl-tRNA synthetase alpha chain